MGLFNKFKRNDEENSHADDCHDYSVKFKVLYERYSSQSPVNRPLIFDELKKLRDSWSFECTNDSNFQFANLIVGKLSNEHMLFEENFNEAKFNMNSSNDSLRQWYLDTAEEVLNLDKKNETVRDSESDGSGFDSDFFKNDDSTGSAFDSDFFGGSSSEGADSLQNDDSDESGFEDDFFNTQKSKDDPYDTKFFGAGMSSKTNSDFFGDSSSKGSAFDSDFFGTDKPDVGQQTQNRDKGTYDYLNDLIHSGEKEIILDSDITFEGLSKYQLGLPLNIDNLIIDGNGHTIDADNKARIFLIFEAKNITIKNITLKNGFTSLAGGAISSRGSDLKLINVTFENNCSNHGGAVYNSNSQITIKDCKCRNNVADGNGGAIYNEESGFFEIINTELVDNTAKGTGGSISNFDGTITLKNSNFSNNSSKKTGGSIYNDIRGTLDIYDNTFSNSRADSGGAIANFGKLDITEGKFLKNTSQNSGGAIYNHIDSHLTVSNVEFKNNKSALHGGVIKNIGDLKLVGCNIEENSAKEGAALFSDSGSKLNISDSTFIANISEKINGEVILNRSLESRIEKSHFKNHKVYNLINNENYLECSDSFFTDNSCQNIILNNKSADLSVVGGEFKSNATETSVITNIGKSSSVSKTLFEDNESGQSFSDNILNESELNLTQLKIERDYECILNRGHIIFKGFKEEIINKIHEDGGTTDIIEPPKDSEYGFYYLDQLIHNGDKSIQLDKDILMNNSDNELYGGGIELDIDGLEIDGKGRCIDANDLSRIFTVSANNITLKNIVFKNGAFKSRFDEHASGGGAIYIIRNASLTLEKCLFIDNKSSGDGGVILNNGTLDIKNSEFENNRSDYYGGVILNNGILTSENDIFKNNKSKLGSVIYNKGILNIKSNRELSNNSSDFKQPIYNVNLINTTLNPDELVYPCLEVDVKSKTSKTFTCLKEKMRESEKVSLNEDIIFDFIQDECVESLDINKNLVIDGNGFSIDGNNSGRIFKVAKLINVIFKNITFKNFNLVEQSLIENNGQIQFINCKFINNISFKNTLIENRHNVSFNGSVFLNNFSKKKSLIHNHYDLDISGCKFINNDSYSQGGVITNELKAEIDNADFLSNKSKNRAGVIHNVNQRCTLEISNSKLSHNASNIDAGAILNFGKVNIVKSEFNKNYSKVNGGAIYNGGGDITVNDAVFAYNSCEEYGSSIINRNDCHLTVNDSEFINNISGKNKGVISNVDNAVIKAYNCEFKPDVLIPVYFTNKENVFLENCKVNLK